MKMTQRQEAYITWIDEKSAKVSLKPPPTFMPGILLQPTRINHLVRTLNKSFFFSFGETLKQIITRYKRAEEEAYISVMFEESQTTPCHFSPQGSPPKASQWGRDGAPKVMYKLLIAETAEVIQQNKKKTNPSLEIKESFWRQNIYWRTRTKFWVLELNPSNSLCVKNQNFRVFWD